MNDVLQFLIQHGYTILFGVVFLEQAGLPVASVPVLLGVGALSAEGHFSIAVSLLLAVAASLCADIIWYELGRLRGFGVLRVLCRISLEPDTCVRRTTGAFRKHGPGTLVAAKFIPGFGAVATPMAGLLGMSLPRFLILDTTGVALWAGLYLGLGVVFRSQLEKAAAVIARTGISLAVAAICLVGGYVAWKWRQRQRWLRQLETARIAPQELWRRMQAGEDFAILDLRHVKAGSKLPGALRFPPEELETRHQEIPRDRNIVLYCT